MLFNLLSKRSDIKVLIPVNFMPNSHESGLLQYKLNHFEAKNTYISSLKG
jgi:hypothetical protein